MLNDCNESLGVVRLTGKFIEVKGEGLLNQILNGRIQHV